MGSKFIRNTDDATIICRITSNKDKVFVFRTKKFDKRNNVLLSNGYTEVSDEDLALLQAESSAFISYSAKGKLTVADNLPMESMSVDQLVTTLKSEVASLKASLKAAQSGTDTDALQNQLDAMTTELAEVSGRMAELE